MKFEMPKMNVEEFEIVDVIMTSVFEEGCTDDSDACGNDLGFDD